MYDVIILGAGPAGLSAAIYCKRANLNVIVLDTYILGGNPVNYSEIENYLGFGKIQTFDLIQKFREHIELLDIPVLEFQNIIDVDLQNNIIKTEEKEYKSKYIIIATGSKPRMLNIPGEKEYIGKGVHYCAICDGPQYKDKDVAVIGGGNSACEEALGLSKICNHVHIIEFTNKLNADKTTIDKIYNTKNIAVSLNTKVTDIVGDDKLTGIKILPSNRDDVGKITLKFDGIFIYIGMSPNLPKFKETPLEKFLNEYGYIMVDKDMRTIVDNIYAIGDITSKKYRQVVTAISDGAIAAIDISKR